MRMVTTVALLGLLGCGSELGVSQKEHDAVVAERDGLQKKVKSLEEKLGAAKKKSRHKPPARKGPAPAKIEAWLEEANITRDSKLGATIKTNKGDIECELWPNKSPLTVANFVGLAEGTKEWTHPGTKEKSKKPLYDGVVFHRVIKGFMLQGGDPMGTGRGGPGYRFEDEVSNDLSFDKPGLLAMANSGPGTNGSQFFVMDGMAKWLNGKHTIFGLCQTEVAHTIALAPVKKPGDRPVDEVKINTIKIKRL